MNSEWIDYREENPEIHIKSFEGEHFHKKRMIVYWITAFVLKIFDLTLLIET